MQTIKHPESWARCREGDYFQDSDGLWYRRLADDELPSVWDALGYGVTRDGKNKLVAGRWVVADDMDESTYGDW